MFINADIDSLCSFCKRAEDLSFLIALFQNNSGLTSHLNLAMLHKFDKKIRLIKTELEALVKSQ